MNKHKFKIVAVLIALGFWVLESLLHVLFFNDPQMEILPTDPNELWMRILIILLLVAFGSYVDIYMRMLKKKEEEKVDVYEAMIYSSHNILNNFLHQMQIVKLAAKDCEDFDKRTLVVFDEIVDEAVTLIDKLGNVPNLTREDIQAAVRLR